jgi:Ethanolamine utilization protein EutJ (predicted chaperonin)
MQTSSYVVQLRASFHRAVSQAILDLVADWLAQKGATIVSVPGGIDICMLQDGDDLAGAAEHAIGAVHLALAAAGVFANIDVVDTTWCEMTRDEKGAVVWFGPRRRFAPSAGAKPLG